MKIYGFISEKLASSYIVTLLTDVGEILDKFEVYNRLKAKDWAQERIDKYKAKYGYVDYQWFWNPEDEALDMAKKSYERRYGCDLKGKPISD